MATRQAQGRRAAHMRRRQTLSPAMIIAAVVLVALGFGLGWHFGVQSTRFHGDILLVNTQHRLNPIPSANQNS